MTDMMTMRITSNSFKDLNQTSNRGEMTIKITNFKRGNSFHQKNHKIMIPMTINNPPNITLNPKIKVINKGHTTNREISKDNLSRIG